MEVTQTVIDYQQIVTICAQCMAVALPIGVIFGISGRIINFFLGMVTGKERVNL